jgi:hypothetical protein
MMELVVQDKKVKYDYIRRYTPERKNTCQLLGQLTLAPVKLFQLVQKHQQMAYYSDATIATRYKCNKNKKGVKYLFVVSKKSPFE